MNEDTIEKFYQEGLEERLISYLAKENGISLEKAMDIYYRSNMAKQIHEGSYGVQYLDYKVLARILMITESHLFENGCTKSKIGNSSCTPEIS